MKKLLPILLVLLLMPSLGWGKCVNSTSYTLYGYLEDSGNNPVTGKTLSEVLFDVFYTDGTDTTANAATAEMGQGWYRYTYTSNGKAGVWIARDSTATYKNFPGGLLENLCDAQLLEIASTGVVGIDLDNAEGTLDAAEIGADAITAAKVAADTIGASELATDAIGAAEIAADAITAAELATDSISSDELAASALAEINTEADTALTDYDAVIPGDLTTAAGVADAVLQESVDDHKATANSLAEHVDDIQVATATASGFLTGTAEASSTTTTIVDTTVLVSTQANAYVGSVVEVDGELRIVRSFNPATDTITLWTAFSAEPDAKTWTMTRDALNDIWNKLRKLK